jgi:lambda family phage portal protein
MNMNPFKMFVSKPKQNFLDSPYLPTSERMGKMGNLLNQILSYFTDDGTKYDIYSTLIQARNYAIADPFITSYLRVMKNQVVGHTGFTLQSKVSCFDVDNNTDINNKIEKEWLEFGKAKNLDITGRFNRVDFLQLALERYLIDGEIVIRLYKTGNYGLQLQLLMFEAIDFKMNNGIDIFHGIQIDNTGTPIRYYIKGVNQKSEPVPASEIIHIVNYFDTGVYRGKSFLTSVLPLVKDLNTYRKAEITAATMENINVFKYKADKDYGRSYEGARTAEDEINRKPGSGSQPNKASVNEEMILKAFENSSIRVGSMAIEALPPGVDLEQMSSNHPNGNSPEFMKQFHKLEGAGLGISYLTLMLDLDASTYSGGTQTAMLERPTFKRFRAILIENLMSKVYELWLPSVIKKYSGLMVKNEEGVYTDYFEHEFMGLGFGAINAKDEMATAISGVEANIITYTDVWTGMGIDPDDQIRKIVTDREKFKAAGIPYGPPAPVSSQNPIEDGPETVSKTPKNEAKTPKNDQGPGLKDTEDTVN